MRGGQRKTERNAQIREMLARGLTVQEVADALGMKKPRVWQIACRDKMPRGPSASEKSSRCWASEQARRAEKFVGTPEAQAITEAKKAYWERSA